MDFDSFESNVQEKIGSRAIVLKNGEIERTLDYGDIMRLSDTLFHACNKHFLPQTCIGLFMEHNIHIPSIILSLHKMDCAFIFFNPNDPLKATEIVVDLGICYIVSQGSENSLKLDALFMKTLNLAEDLFLHKIKDNPKDNNQKPIASYQDIAYVIKTSGTTGNKKYVKVFNRCIRANIENLRYIFNITSSDLIYFGTPLIFDPSMVELYLSLSSFATLVITSSETRANPKLLLETLFPIKQSWTVTVMQIVPSVLQRWSQTEINRIISTTNLRVLAIGGEPFPPKAIFANKSQNLKVFNLYGITEVSCWATCFNIDDDSGNELVSLGEPLSETFIELKNDEDETSDEGEICIGSTTRICDIQTDEIKTDTCSFRRSGDIGYKLNGLLYYSGRKDINILKRNGERINLLEIEQQITHLTDLKSVCVWIESYSQLAVFLIIENASDQAMDKIRIRLLTNLPSNSMPTHILHIDQVPLTANGKVDRTSLKILAVKRVTENYTENQDWLEIFQSLWRKYFGDNFDRSKSFYEMGGDSIKQIEFNNEFKHLVGGNDMLDSSFSIFMFTERYEDICSLFCTSDVKHGSLKRLQESISFCRKAKRKKAEYSLKLNVRWKYDMLACVDTKAVIFRYKEIEYITLGSFSHQFAVLNAENGEKLFELTLPDSIENSVLVSEDSEHIFVGCFDGKMYCIAMDKHSIKWSYKTGDRIKNTPCYFIHKNRQHSIIFGSYDSYVYCLNSEDGALIWKTFLKESIVASPVLSGSANEVRGITNKGTFFVLNATNGNKLYFTKTGAPVFGTPILYKQKDCYESCIYADVNGFLHVVIPIGKDDYVTRRQKLDLAVFGSPVLMEKMIIVCSTDGAIDYFDINQSVINRTTHLHSRISTTPCISRFGNKDILTITAADGNIFIIDALSCEVLLEYALPGECFSSPLVNGHFIYVGCRDNYVYCLEIEAD